MLILAIDTALDACAAGVLDTTAGELIAQESQPMKRGHAEALMPLIARVIKESGIAFASLDRIAVTTGPGSFTGLRVGLSAARGIALAANKPVVGLTTLTAYAAPLVSQNAEQPVIAAIDARHDQVYFQVVSGNGSSLIRPRVAPIEEALGASRFGAPHLVGNAAKILADRWPAHAAPPFSAHAPPPVVGVLLGGRGGEPRSGGTPRLPAPFICARPMPNLKKIRCRKPRSPPRHNGVALRTVERRRGSDRTRDPARCVKAPAASRRIVPSRLGRRRIRGHADRAQHAGSPPEDRTEDYRLCGVAHGGRRGRNTFDRRCPRPARPRPVTPPVADASRPSRGPRRACRIPRGRGKQSAGAAAL